MRRVLMGLLAAVMAATTAHAWEWDFGYWYVSQEPTDYGFHTTMAVLTEGGVRNGVFTLPLLAVRCMNRMLDVLVAAPTGAANFTTGTKVTINFSSDVGPAELSANGEAVKANIVAFVPTAAIAHELLAGNSYSVRFESGTKSFNHTWKAQNRMSALSWVQKECPFN